MSTNNDASISRRTLLATAGMGAFAAWALPETAASAGAGATAAEKANTELVTQFIRGWTKKNYDPAKEMATYLSSPCQVRPVEDKPALTTPADAAKVFIDFMKDGSRVERVDFHHVFATGPVVVTRRTDVVVTPGKPNTNYEIAGVFLVKDGKIREWVDYLAG